MKKFGTWVLNHMVLVLAILVFGISFAVFGGVMISSRLSYKAYEARYNANDLAVRSLSPAQPTNIEILNNFKSKQKNKLAFSADELIVTTTQTEYLVDNYIDLTQRGGEISIALSTAEKTFLDIDFEITTANEYQVDGETEIGVERLLSNVQFIINGETMDEEINLKGDEWQHLIMLGFALPEGDVNIQIKSMSGKNAMMPLVKGITLFSSAKLEAA